jgi:hypothetical protein
VLGNQTRKLLKPYSSNVRKRLTDQDMRVIRHSTLPVVARRPRSIVQLLLILLPRSRFDHEY